MHYSLSQKDEVRLGIGHGAWGIGHGVPWAYLTFLRTAISDVPEMLHQSIDRFTGVAFSLIDGNPHTILIEG